jgi:hypothetical protein
MAKQTVNIGTTVNDGTGDTIRDGGDKINDNFNEIYTLLGTGTALTSGLSATSSVVTLAGPTVTGVASFAAGSAGAPSITKTGDTNTGIFFSAADEVAITTAGTQRLKIDNSTATFAGAITGGGLLTTGGNIIIPDAGTLGSASSTSAMTIASTGIVTFVDDIVIKDGGTIGSSSATSAMTVASTGIVTFVDDIVIKDVGTIGSSTTPGAITIAANGDVTFSGAISTGGSAFREQGKETIWVPVGAMRPTVSNGCAPITEVETTSGRPDMQVLDFDATSDEHAQFQIAFPKSWNEGTITFQVYWTTTASDTDGVAWGLQGVAVSDNDTIDVAYGTAVVVTDDALGAAEDQCVTAESSAVTIAGTPAVNDICYFRIFRDVSDSNDDMTEDARLIGIRIFFTTDAANDA